MQWFQVGKKPRSLDQYDAKVMKPIQWFQFSRSNRTSEMKIMRKAMKLMRWFQICKEIKTTEWKWYRSNDTAIVVLVILK